MQIVARVDANGRVGTGHAVRVRAIVDTLDSDAQLLVIGQGEELESIFPNGEIRKPAETLSTQIADAVAQTSPALVLCDHPELEPDLRHDLDRRVDVPVIIIDDFGGDHRASGIVNGTILPTHHHYPDQQEDALKLCGGDYALLRPSFGEVTRPTTSSRAVGIVVGSGERATAWVNFLVSGALDLSQLGAVGIVVGRAYPEPDALAKKCAARGISFSQALSEQALADFLASSQVALVTGGMIVYESLAVGTPTIIFPLLQNMVAEAAWFDAHDCAVSLGSDGGFDAVILRQVITSLLADPESCEHLSAAGHASVDGLGVSRVCATLREHFDLTVNTTP